MLALAALMRELGGALSDPLFMTWHRDDAVRYLNAGIAMVAQHRADSCAAHVDVPLVAGTAQRLPAGALRLMDAVCNVRLDDGEVVEVGRALRVVERRSKDAARPRWHGQTGAEVREIIYDERFPQQFFIWPTPDDVDGMAVRLGVAQSPPAFEPMGSLEQQLVFDPQYTPAILEWALYRAFMRDGEASPNAGRAVGHLQNFNQILNIKTRVDHAFAAAPRQVAQGAG